MAKKTVQKSQIVIIKDIEYAQFFLKGEGLEPVLMHRSGQFFSLKIEILPVNDPTDETRPEEIPGDNPLKN